MPHGEETVTNEKSRGSGSNADYYDYNLIAVIILLIGFGLVMLYSTSSYSAGIKFNNDLYFFKKQAVISIVAIAAAVAVSFLDYHVLWRLSGFLYFSAIILMLLTRTPIGITVNGARRWIRIMGVSFQPAEVAKIAVIVFLPVMIVKMGRKFRGIKAVLPPFIAGLIQAFAALVFTQNLSTAIIIMMISCVIIFIAHPDTLPFLLLAAGVAAVAALIVFLIARSGAAGNCRSMRILVWLNPEKYAREQGYQIMQSLYALGSGGLFGKGLGNSTQKLGALPEAENDMIFSILCEELGVFGGMIIIMLFIYLLYRLFFIAQNAQDLFGALMVTGIFGHIALQVIFNICVVVNLIPTTGITLPFVSYGGTSVVFLMLEMAIALSVSMQIRFKRTELDLWGEVVGGTEAERA